jgi:phosphogluconate dehydratase
MAACSQSDKNALTDELVPNIAIVTAYNDMLSAHQPYSTYPQLIKNTAEGLGAVAQVAGGVPAMCDGVTQGQDGMELSLFSRDVIALSTAVALSHNMFDAGMYLGVCDKIVPGLLIGALSFGHLPAIFVPAGPMSSGLPNKEKAAVREAFAAGEADKQELIAAESASYHSAGTCTFYGTANSNQMLMEMMGLQLPGSSFVNPNDPLRDEFTRFSVGRVLGLTYENDGYLPLAKIVDEKAIVNGVVGLLATGGSTNHTIHLIAIAAAAGIILDWTDMADLSKAIPLLAQIYPSGTADVNQFHAAGGLAYVMDELIQAGLLHNDVNTIAGFGLERYTHQPEVLDDGLGWLNKKPESRDYSILRTVEKPFSAEGGIRVVEGNVGRAIVKVSAVGRDAQKITAPARVFTDQLEFEEAFEAGQLNEDMVVVVTGQGPVANGMPELHKLSPYLGVMQNKGLKVALLTDGRMSGASGKILAAIQVTPEAAIGGSIGKLRDGDLITIDAVSGSMSVAASIEERSPAYVADSEHVEGMGRELFAGFRSQVSTAESGGSIFTL